MPCALQVAVEQGMEHALRSAPRALVSGEFVNQTFGHKPFCRVYDSIYDRYHGNDRYQEQEFSARRQGSEFVVRLHLLRTSLHLELRHLDSRSEEHGDGYV